MNKFSQWKYVLVAYALKNTGNTSEISKYLCQIIKVGFSGDTPERSVNMYVAQNMRDNLHGRQHKGSWYVRVDNGEYRLDCPQDLKSKISYVKYAKYDTNKSLVFSEHDFYNIVAEFLDKDSSLDKNKILECCHSVAVTHKQDQYNVKHQPIFNVAELQKVLASYKAVFVSKQWPEEKYKWVAVKHFQDNWDIDAPDFAAVLKNALAKTGNLLVSVNNFPARMITEFAEVASEQVRAMFKELFDETLDIWQRVESFKEKSQPLLGIHGKNAKNHYQGENTIFTYLWLRYPEKYYIYKISELKAVAETLHSNLVFQNGKYEDNIRNFLKLYDAIRQELLKDDELKTLLKSQLTDDCYSDEALCTLTIDFGFYISRRYNNANNEAEISEQTDEYSSEEQPQALTYYSRKDFLSNVFITADKYDSLVRMLKAKKNIILQGAPGVGKTFAARRLAYSIMGVKDDSRIEFVQFHQNYSYEDFVMGYKPNENGFELKKGIFYSFCQKAASTPDKDYFFIIDEINRGNMSKIFGELLMLIEKDYRGTPLTLAYNGLPFRVPKNLHIIGMMNTADRSLAMIDYALRRRFSFFDMEPGFDSDGFKSYQQDLNSEKLNRLVAELKSLNNAIIEDKSLGQGFCIGHSYLCGEEICKDEWLQGVVEYDILPMLAEYWFDELDKYEEWKKRLTDAVK